MTEYKNSRINWESFILGVLYLIVAIIAFKDPRASLMSMSVLLGIFVILSGVGDIYLRNKFSKYYEKDTTNLSLISGVVQIILGIIILVDIQTTFVALPYMFAIWFIFTSIIGIIIISPLKIFSYGIWTSLVILNILGVIIGFMMINNPMSASITIVTLVGFYFLFLAIKSIIHAFQYYNYK